MRRLYEGLRDVISDFFFRNKYSIYEFFLELSFSYFYIILWYWSYYTFIIPTFGFSLSLPIFPYRLCQTSFLLSKLVLFPFLNSHSCLNWIIICYMIMMSVGYNHTVICYQGFKNEFKKKINIFFVWENSLTLILNIYNLNRFWEFFITCCFPWISRIITDFKNIWRYIQRCMSLLLITDL